MDNKQDIMQMPRRRVYLHNEEVDNNYANKTGSIVLPYNVRRIVGICPNMVNGAGFLSIYNENSNEQLINQYAIADDNIHWNKKNIPLVAYPERSNLRYNLVLTDSSIGKECRLKVYITYEE